MFQACRNVKSKHNFMKSMDPLLLKINNLATSAGYTNDNKGFVLKLSMTRGTPSTSNDLKEALCEKIPLHHDLLRRFRQSHGLEVVSQITVNDIYRGLDGVDALIRETSEVDSKSGIKYRGLSIPELFDLLPRRGNSPCPEAVFWLLLTGDVPTHEQTEALMADWTERRDKRKDWWWSESSGEAGGVVGNVLRALPKNVPPVGRLAIALTALDADKHYKKAVQTGAMSYTYWEHIYEDSMELLASLPAIVALVSSGESRPTPLKLEKADWVEFFLDCLHNATDSFTEQQKQGLADFLRLFIAVNAKIPDDADIHSSNLTHKQNKWLFLESRLKTFSDFGYTERIKSKKYLTNKLIQHSSFEGKKNSIVWLRNNRCNLVASKCDKMSVFLGNSKCSKEITTEKEENSISSENIKTKGKESHLITLPSNKTVAVSRKKDEAQESKASFNNRFTPFPKPVFQNNHDCTTQNFKHSFKVIIFDLETTGLSKYDKICQIAACTNETSFNIYINPLKPILKSASAITGLQCIDRTLYYQDKKVKAFSAKIAFIRFLAYLKNFECPVILLAHNCFRFDMPRMLNLASNLGLMDDFKSVVVGFADSLIISKNLLKNRVDERKKFSLEALVRDYYPTENVKVLHNAVNDTKMLKKFLDKIGVTDDTVKKYTKGIDQVLFEEKYKSAVLINKASLKEYESCISTRIINKMVNAGINKQILQQIAVKEGLDGIRILLGKSINGATPVTTDEKILIQIYKLFSI